MKGREASTEFTRALAELLVGRPEIADAAAFSRGDQQLAVLIVQQGFSLGPMIRNTVLELPAEQPADLTVALVDHIPRTVAGQLDVAAATALLSESEYVYRYEPPSTDVERSVTRWLADAAGLSHVSVTDDLISLGTDSLVAVELAEFLETEFGAVIEPDQLASVPTVRELARLAESTGGRE